VTDLIRPMADDEAGAAVAVHVAARLAAAEQGTMPPPVHPISDARRWFEDEVVGRREIWVAERAGRLVGLLVLDAGFVDQIYVRPEVQGEGIGASLLDLAMALRPQGFDLWVFEINAPAIALYESRGLKLVERTDGAGNEERAPDLRYRWIPPVAASGP
jgi:ribosomal protein S18 acetylase RimI-like enzyme